MTAYLTAPKIKIGDAVSCFENDNVYRYVGNNTIRLYPNSIIANSWDLFWQSGYCKKNKIQCSKYKIGPEMEPKKN